MEVVNPTPAVDFNFDSASTSPYITAPSSPQRFGPFFYSAPASPAFYRAGGTPSSVPFDWEDKPGLPKGHVSAPSSDHGGDDDFAFDFSGHLDPSPADELFAGGKIKPLKPPPGLQHDSNSNSTRSSPRSPREIIRKAFSPKRRGATGGFDPFAAALERARGEGARRNAEEKKEKRERTRSLVSPYRVSDLLFEPDPAQEPAKSPPSWYKKWRIKDLLLFRSASESRAKEDEAELDSAAKRTVRRDEEDDVRSSSSRRRSGPSISAHEVHYTVNRQLSEEMKKRTFLPYKQGLLGCLGFHPTVPDVSTKGIN